MTKEKIRERYRAIVADAESGFTLEQIRARHHVSIGTIYRAFSEIGVKRGNHLPHNSTWKILARIFQSRSSLRTVAHEFGVTHQRVEQIYKSAKDAGIPVPVPDRHPYGSK